MTLAAGKLHHLITIERPIEAHRFGEVVITWEEFAKAWAQVKPISSGEYFELESQGASVTHRITLRPISGINSKMRIRYGSRIFEIAGIPRTLDERGRLMEITATEGE